MPSNADRYADSAEYLHLLSAPMWTALRPRLALALREVDPAGGPLVELGAGTGLATDVLLDAVGNDVVAVEPSAALRAVLLARLAGRSRERVTVQPCGALEIDLPRRVGGVVGMHMVGHLPATDRARLWTAVTERLTAGAPVVLNVQPPEIAAAVPASPWSGVIVGGLTYEGTGQAEPAGPDSVTWRMTYRTRRGDEVLATTTVDYRWWVMSADALAAELTAAGLTATVDGDLVVARAPSTT
jgi:hypothetical protein